MDEETTTHILTLLALLLPLVLIPAAMVFRRASKFPVDNRTVVITGGSQGMGLAVAKKLASCGASIAIVARDEEKLSSALSEIEDKAREPSQRFLSLSYDLTDPKSAPEILKKVTEWNGGHPPDVVWCCAGYCEPAFFADASIETQRSQMDTLYWSAAYMAHATINLWKTPTPLDASGSKASSNRNPEDPRPLPRHLIFTSSVACLMPMAGYTHYTAAKSAMRALADSLQHEVAIYNGAATSPTLPTTQKPPAEIKVHAIFPMGITSPNYARENELKPSFTHMLEESDKPQSPEEVADAAIRGLDGGQIMIGTSWLGKLMVGAGLASSLRMGFMDILWNVLGSIIIIFVGWDFRSKALKWGKEKGMQTGPNVAKKQQV